jgi:hypothetical protein
VGNIRPNKLLVSAQGNDFIRLAAIKKGAQSQLATFAQVAFAGLAAMSGPVSEVDI